MRKSIIIVILLAFCVVKVSSQGYYLPKGIGGFQISGQVETNSEGSGYGGGIGFSAKGVVDFGLDISHIATDQSYKTFNHSYKTFANTYVPYITFHAIKQSEKTPFSFCFNGGYARTNLTNKAVENDPSLHLYGNSFMFGVELYKTLGTTQKLKAQPLIGANYTISKATVKTSTKETTETEKYWIFGLGFTFFIEATQKSTFVFSPYYAFGEDVESLGFELSYVFRNFL